MRGSRRYGCIHRVDRGVSTWRIVRRGVVRGSASSLVLGLDALSATFCFVALKQLLHLHQRAAVTCGDMQHIPRKLRMVFQTQFRVI